MAEAYRVLKHNRLMLCFYGWPRAEKFLEAWREAGFGPVGHLVFRKSYTTKSTDFLKYQHEQAYLLTKGRPPMMGSPLPDVQRLLFTGNKLHPTQKAAMSLVPIIRAYSLPGDVVLDAFCGSGSTCAAALLTGRKYIGIELDTEYHEAAAQRMERVKREDRKAVLSGAHSHVAMSVPACPPRLKATSRLSCHSPTLTRGGLADSCLTSWE